MLGDEPARSSGGHGKRLEPVNAQAGEPSPRVWTLGDWIRDVFLPLSRRKWKLSTASTTGDRIRKHLITDLGTLEIPCLSRGRCRQASSSLAAGQYGPEGKSTLGQISPALHHLIEGGYLDMPGRSHAAGAIPPKRILLPTVLAMRTLDAFQNESLAEIQSELDSRLPR